MKKLLLGVLLVSSLLSCTSKEEKEAEKCLEIYDKYIERILAADPDDVLSIYEQYQSEADRNGCPNIDLY